jgi:hypothetical protein
MANFDLTAQVARRRLTLLLFNNYNQSSSAALKGLDLETSYDTVEHFAIRPRNNGESARSKRWLQT